MSFIIENENQNITLLFDADIIPEEKAFATPKFPKPNFSGIYTHFDCFLLLFLSLMLLIDSHIDASEYAQVGLNYPLN